MLGIGEVFDFEQHTGQFVDCGDAIEEVAQNAAARTIFGEVPFSGKLPVGVPGIFEIGAGIVK